MNSTPIPLSVVVATKSGLMYHSLLAFLSVLPNVQIVGLVRDIELVLTATHQNRPNVLILDTNLSESHVPGLIQRLKAEIPTLNCVVLANNVRQQSASLSAGANHALLKGFLDGQLTQAVLATKPN